MPVLGSEALHQTSAMSAVRLARRNGPVLCGPCLHLNAEWCCSEQVRELFTAPRWRC
jgi:hypothetical protein